MKTSCVRCDGRGVIPQNGEIVTCPQCDGLGNADMSEEETKAYQEWVKQNHRNPAEVTE